MNSERELISILSLVGDPDVGRLAVEQLREGREEAINSIEAIDNRSLYLNDTLFASLMTELKVGVAVDKLTEILKLPEPPLSRILFLLTKVARPECDEVIWNDVLEDLILDLSLEISAEKTDIERIEIFNYLFFSRFMFNYDDSEIKCEDCALIDRVLISRKGNPVVMSMIYFLLSRGVGLPVYPFCFPNGFIPAYVNDSGEIAFYMNVFDKGSIFYEERLKVVLKDLEVDGDIAGYVGDERAVASIYIEMLLFLYENIQNFTKVSTLQPVRALVCGDKKYL